MWARRIHEHKDASHEQNFFLDLVLGLVATAERVGELTGRLRLARRPTNTTADVTRASTTADVTPASTTADVTRASDPEGCLHGFDAFVLGLSSFSRAVRARVEAAAPDTTASETAAAASDSATRLPGRDLLL